MAQGFLSLICEKYELEPWFGLDIARKSNASHKQIDELELRDLDIVFEGIVFGTPSFPAANMLDAFQKVINRFYKQDNEETEEQEEKVLVIKNSNIIKAMHLTKDGRKFIITHRDEDTKKASEVFGEFAEVKAAADLLLKKRHVECFEKLAVGTLDLPKNGEMRFQVYKADGSTEPVRLEKGGRIPRDQVLASLWIASQLYVNAPSYRKHMTVEITAGKYTMGFKANKFYFNQDNLDDFEKAIISDIIKIGESTKEDFQTAEEYFKTNERVIQNNDTQTIGTNP